MTDNPKQLQSEIGEADMGTIPQSRRGAPARLPDIKGRAGPAAAPCPRPAPPAHPPNPRAPSPRCSRRIWGKTLLLEQLLLQCALGTHRDLPTARTSHGGGGTRMNQGPHPSCEVFGDWGGGNKAPWGTW